MKRFISLTAVFMLAVCAFSQTKATLSGFVKDSQSGEALSYATIQVLGPDSTKFVSGGVTNSLGGYSIKNVVQGKYVVKISYLGYHNFFRAVEVKEKQTTVNVGTVMMIPNSVVLQAAEVTAALQQVEVKEDTVIFNADAFKTPEGSVLEELIKKLPGAQIDDSGNITINGKTVTKILVKGKEFFDNDKDMALKNLPTEIIDKIKVYDKKSDQARITGIDDGNEETVIDLGIKKGMNQGWFGNIDGGIGTHSLYTGRAMVNRFTDNTQASLIGNLGNTGGNGTRTTQSYGLNAVVSEEDKYEIGGNVRFNYSKSDSWNKRSSENFVSVTNQSFQNSYNKSKSHSNGFNGNFKIEWKIDTLTTLLFRPNFSFGNNDSWSKGNSATFAQDPYLVEGITNPLDQFEQMPDSILIDNVLQRLKTNRNLTGNTSDGDNKSLSGNLMLSHRMSTTGRNISVRLNASWNESGSDSYNINDVTYYTKDAQGKTQDPQFIYRYRDTPTNNKSWGAGFTYSEPLVANTLYLQASYNYSYSGRESDSRTYNLGDAAYIKNNVNGIQDSILNNIGYVPESVRQSLETYYDYSLSRYSYDQNYNHNIELSLRLNNERINGQIGVQYQPQHQKIEYSYLGHDTIASRNYARISPTMNIRYRFSKQHDLRIRYRGNLTQPSITNLFDWDDDTNPLRTSHGNPDLQPSFTNNVNIDYNNYITSRYQNYNARLSWSNTINSISQITRYYAETGKTETTPENINGNWSMSGSFGFGSPLFAQERLMLNINVGGSFNNNVAYIFQNYETLKNNVKNWGANSWLSLTYRWDYMDVRASGNVRYSNSKSELISSANKNTWDFSYGLSSTGNFESGWGYSTDINMSSRRGYSSSEMNTNEMIWNAQISYRFLTGKKATISLRAQDILHERSNISRMISSTSRSDSESGAIYNYFMLNFTYRFNLFGTAEVRRNMRNMRRGGGMEPGFDNMNFQGMTGEGTNRMGGGEAGGNGGGGGM